MPLVPWVAGQNLTAEQLNQTFDYTRVRCQTADQTANTTTLVNSNDLVFTVAALSWYTLSGVVFYDTSSAIDFAFNLSVPASSTTTLSYWGQVATNSAVDDPIVHSASSSTAFTAGAVALGTIMSFRPAGLIVVGTASGNIIAQFAQGTASASNTILKTGSFLTLTQVA